MNYINVEEAAKKWNVSERRVTLLCRNGRIIGAKKESKLWLVPDVAKLPKDGRTKEAVEEAKIASKKSNISYTTSGAINKVSQIFNKLYSKQPESVVFTPYHGKPDLGFK